MNRYPKRSLFISHYWPVIFKTRSLFVPMQNEFTCITNDDKILILEFLKNDRHGRKNIVILILFLFYFSHIGIPGLFSLHGIIYIILFWKIYRKVYGHILFLDLPQVDRHWLGHVGRVTNWFITHTRSNNRHMSTRIE